MRILLFLCLLIALQVVKNYGGWMDTKIEDLREGTFEQVQSQIKQRINHVGEMKLLSSENLQCQIVAGRKCMITINTQFGDDQHKFDVVFIEKLDQTVQVLEIKNHSQKQE